MNRARVTWNSYFPRLLASKPRIRRYRQAEFPCAVYSTKGSATLVAPPRVDQQQRVAAPPIYSCILGPPTVESPALWLSRWRGDPSY